ncbi:MAG TPA: Stp1/IreP family PP2C-type Ser/Thr phosphatase [Blastocatellia bacterium]|nr:Stp1/IreP family PP2C-type Ser/Thr phosphatase [Blastocatellia bacterium]
MLSHKAMSRNLVIAHRTDLGMQRKENQDACGFWRDTISGDHLLVVADGMGGAACGSAASRLAVRIIQEHFFNTAWQQIAINERLAQAIIVANQMVHQEAEANPQCQGMGTTCVVVAISGRYAFLAHVGDSRIYLVREQRIARLTRDHSLVQRMLDDGLIEEEEAATHPQKNVLQRAIGPRLDIVPEVRPEPVELQPGDILVLCTDGLCGLVDDHEIFELAMHNEPQPACDGLVNLANERGGPDNITVAICKVES